MSKYKTPVEAYKAYLSRLIAKRQQEKEDKDT